MANSFFSINTAREMKSCRVTKKTKSLTINAHVTTIIGYVSIFYCWSGTSNKQCLTLLISYSTVLLGVAGVREEGGTVQLCRLEGPASQLPHNTLLAQQLLFNNNATYLYPDYNIQIQKTNSPFILLYTYFHFIPAYTTLLHLVFILVLVYYSSGFCLI